MSEHEGHSLCLDCRNIRAARGSDKCGLCETISEWNLGGDEKTVSRSLIVLTKERIEWCRGEKKKCITRANETAKLLEKRCPEKYIRNTEACKAEYLRGVSFYQHRIIKLSRVLNLVRSGDRVTNESISGK
jgi:hypothetical protein